MQQAAAGGAPGITPLLVLVRELWRVRPAALQQRVMCKLLCTSNATRAAIAQHCAGKLALRCCTYSTERVTEHFARWLAQHGGLLASLSLEVNLPGSSISEAEAAISAALQQARSSRSAAPAAAPGSGAGAGAAWAPPAPGLQLRAYCSHPAVAGAVLDQLDSYYLTQLELGRHAAYSCCFALEGLTRLARLTLYEDSADVLLPSLSALTQLTHLVLQDVSASSIAKLRCVGPQLRELQLSLARLRRSEAPPGLCLGHLTALTRLTNGEGRPLLIQAGDVLPPQLAVLRVRDVVDVGPLLGLSSLQELSMCASTTHAGALQRLASSGGGSVCGRSSCSCSGSSGSSVLHSSCGACADSSGLSAAASSSAGSVGSSVGGTGACAGGTDSSYGSSSTISIATSGASTNGTNGTNGTSSSSSSLRAVSLCYDDMHAAAAAAPGWSDLPLASLELRAVEGSLPAHTLHALSRLHLLQRLDVWGGHGGCAAACVLQVSRRDLAAALRQMGSLQALGLRGIGLVEPVAARQEVRVTTAAAAAAAAATCPADTSHLVAAEQARQADVSSSGSSGEASTEDGLCHVLKQQASLSGSGGSNSGMNGGIRASSSSSSSSSTSLQVLLEAAASLPRLACLTLSHMACNGQQLVVDEAAAAALAGGVAHLTSLQLADVGLTDAAGNSLLGGAANALAPQLRKLNLDSNLRLTADVLPDGLASRLVRLQELSVLRTGIRAHAAAFKARMLRLHPQLHVKSSAR